MPKSPNPQPVRSRERVGDTSPALRRLLGRHAASRASSPYVEIEQCHVAAADLANFSWLFTSASQLPGCVSAKVHGLSLLEGTEGLCRGRTGGPLGRVEPHGDEVTARTSEDEYVPNEMAVA